MKREPWWERPPGRDQGLLKAHARDLRKGRHSEPGRGYLITTVTAKRQPVFRDLWHGRCLVSTLRHLHECEAARTLAFVIMPDHLHWLMVLGQQQTLSAVVRRMKSYSARRLGDEFGVSTPVWQSGYHDHAIRTDEDVRGIARYIVANPLRAGLVQRVGDYALWDAEWL